MTIFLFGDLDEKIYLTQPEGFIKKGHETLVCQLKKSLYGLKQATLQWNKALHKSVTEMGFTWTHSDTGVYVFFDKNDIVIMLIYINNALFLGNDWALLMKEKQQFMHKWESQDLGEAKEYLGMRITRDCSKQILKLDQITYAQKVIDHFDMQNCRPSDVPLPTRYNPNSSTEESNPQLQSHY